MPKLTCAIVGFGTIGRIYKTHLNSLGHDFILVDPKLTPTSNQFQSLQSIPKSKQKKIAAWIIGTPTALHFSVLKQILSQKNDALVLVEKPICSQSEIQDLIEILDSFPHAKILPIELYFNSNAVKTLVETVSKLGLSLDECKEILIESTKNRKKDNQIGRYIAEDLGLFGYEFQHLLSILHQILSKKEWENFLNSDGNTLQITYQEDPTDPNTGHVSLHWISASHTKIKLYSSISGDVYDPQAKEFQVPQHIPYGSDEKYRVVRLKFKDCALSLRLEPLGKFQSVQYERQIHLLMTDKNGKKDFLFIKDNAFENALKEKLEWANPNSLKTPQESKTLVLESLTRVKFLGKLKKSVELKK